MLSTRTTPLAPSCRRSRTLRSHAAPLTPMLHHTMRHSKDHTSTPQRSVTCSFQQDDQQTTSPAARSEPVTAEEHWVTLLTTMPGLSSMHWSGRLGEFVTSSGAEVVGRGAILHLWKAEEPEEKEKSGQREERSDQAGAGSGRQQPLTPEKLSIRYFTAPGVSVAEPWGPARSLTGNEAGGAGQAVVAGLSPDGSKFVWHQDLMKAQPTGFVFSPTAPQLSLTLPGSDQQQGQQPDLCRALRLLPLSSSGVCVMNAALPSEWGEGVAARNPPGSYWFFEVLLTHPDASGEWQGSTLGVSYNWADGRLSSNRYSWQKATSPLEQPADDLKGQVVLAAVKPPHRDSRSNLSELLHEVSSTPNLQHTITTYTYDTAPATTTTTSSSTSSGSTPKDQPQPELQYHLHCSHASGPAASDSLTACLSGLEVVVGPVGPVEISLGSKGGTDVHAWFTTAPHSRHLHTTPSAETAAGQEGPAAAAAEAAAEDEEWFRQQVMWFPQGGCWGRVPARLPGGTSAAGGGTSSAAAGSGGDGVVEFEVGVIHGDGKGASRCVLRYSTTGDRRTQAVINEEWKCAE